MSTEVSLRAGGSSASGRCAHEYSSSGRLALTRTVHGEEPPAESVTDGLIGARLSHEREDQALPFSWSHPNMVVGGVLAVPRKRSLACNATQPCP